MKAYQVVIGIDMETDVGSFSPFYKGIKEGTPKLLKIMDEYKIKATFFFTGDAAMKNPEIVREILKKGHEIGAHSLYHESVGDELFENFGTKSILPEEIALRIKKCTNIIEEISGIRPVSFRSPRLWGSTALINCLEELGYISDSSYPVYFHRKQFFPYNPSKNNWLEKGDLKILEIPVAADMQMESNDPGFERDRDPWWHFRTENAETYYKMLLGFLRHIEDADQTPVLCLYFHPWEFVEMNDTFDYGECVIKVMDSIVSGTGEKAVKEFENLIKIFIKENVTFFTAGELALKYK